MNKNFKQIGLPLISALIWGGAFLVQGSVTDRMGAFTVNAMRSLIAFTTLFIISFFVDRHKMKKGVPMGKVDLKIVFIGSLACGTFLFLGSNFQQLALGGNVGGYVTEGEVAFITALYMVLVPVFGIFMKKKTGVNVWIAVGIAIVGLYLICFEGAEFSMNKYVIFAILNAVAYAFHILAVDKYVQTVDPIKLSCGQFFFNFIFSSVAALIFEKISFAAIIDCILPLLYIGIISSSVAFTLQLIAQRGGNPTIVSVLVCTESVFALILQTIIGLINPDKAVYLSVGQYIGCGVMFIAVVVAQLNFSFKKQNTDQ